MHISFYNGQKTGYLRYRRNNMDRKKKGALRAILLAGAVVLSYMICRICNLASGNGWKVKAIMAIGLVGLFLYGVRLWDLKKLTWEKMIGLLMLAGFVMRIGYMLYTGCMIRSHDMHELRADSYGHGAYLLELLQNKRLPQDNQIQKYQQPFFYFMGALSSKFINGILRSKSTYDLVDAAKTVSCIASCYSLVIARDIFRQVGLKEKGMFRAMILAAFLPAFYISGGTVAPDMLAGMFILLALLYTLYWMQKPDLTNTIKLALIYGFGMMTKISCATMACVTAVLFAYRLFKAWKQKEAAGYLKKYIVFAGISLPLGMWYSVRNLIRFGQSLTYVLQIPKDSEIYTGDHSLAQRLFGIQIKNLIETPYANAWGDYNYPVYALKSALFGEFQYEVGKWIPSVLVSLAVLLSIACVAAMIQKRDLIRKERDYGILYGTAIWMYVSSLIFYMKYPFGCSMDYRYMLAFTIPVAAILGKACWGKWERSIDLNCMGFAVMSCAMFCLI